MTSTMGCLSIQSTSHLLIELCWDLSICLQLRCRNLGDRIYKEIEEYRSKERYKLRGA
jgi:hypothetical protein